MTSTIGIREKHRRLQLVHTGRRAVSHPRLHGVNEPLPFTLIRWALKLSEAISYRSMNKFRLRQKFFFNVSKLF